MSTAPSKFLFSLRYKIAIPFVTMVFVMMALVTYIFTIRDMNLRAGQVKLRMQRLANNIATIRSVGSEDWNLYQSYIENQIVVNPDIVYIAIYNEFRDLKAHVLNLKWIEIPEPHRTEWGERRIIVSLEQRNIDDDSQRDFESVSVTILMGNQSRGYVHVGFSKVDINNELRQSLILNLSLGFLFTLVAIFISFYMSQIIVNPLTHLTRAMKQISGGDLNQTVTIKSNDEIGEMAKTFNFMTNGLREKVEIESFGRELGFTLESERTFRLITQRIASAIGAGKSALYLRKSQEICEIFLAATYPESSGRQQTFRCTRDLHNLLKNTETPKPLNCFDAHPEFIKFMITGNADDGEVLVCPIKIVDDVVGLLILTGRKKSASFTETEIAFLGTLIRQAGFALENILLLEQLTENERFKQELKIASQVQQKLLPAEHPDLKAYTLHGLCLPADEIGGDYFDYFKIEKDKYGITIADVTGKGTSAAFYMAMVKGLMLSLTRYPLTPRKLLSELNRLLYGMMDRRVFITMIYAVIDLKNETLTFSRAGHNSLLIKDALSGTVDSRIPEGIGLGLERGELFDANIHEEMIRLNRQQTVLFYTDGIIEAVNQSGEEFGEERLIEFVKTSNHQSAEAVNRSLIEAIHSFTGEAAQHDDMTLITLTPSALENKI